MAWEEYDPKTLRTIMISRGLNAGDVSRRTRGKVGRTTVRNVMIGARPTAQENTLEAIARALYVSRDDLRGDGRDGNRTGGLPH
jgi:hypothetical protein